MVQVLPSMLDAFLSCCGGRRGDYAVQLDDGRYTHVWQPLTYEMVFAHLRGDLTIGVYLIDEEGMTCGVVFDSDAPDGLLQLVQVQTHLMRGAGVVSYLETSRRGGHLRVFFAEPVPAFLARSFLLPYCPAGVEFYPKQDTVTHQRPIGTLMRLPLGVHRLTGERYPFVSIVGGQVVPLVSSVTDALAWFETVERVRVPALPLLDQGTDGAGSDQHKIPFKTSSSCDPVAPLTTIRDWCLSQDPFAVIGHYVVLDQKGMGCCPFGGHHRDGVDHHPSLWVYRPQPPDVMCWYCHVAQQGGSLFDFLRWYYGLEARELWHRILSGARF